MSDIKVDGSSNVSIVTGSVDGSINQQVHYNQRPAAEQAKAIVTKNTSVKTIKSLITVHEDALAQLYIQEAQLGLHCPPHVKTDIADREAALDILRQSLV
jgi:hypothetical protein